MINLDSSVTKNDAEDTIHYVNVRFRGYSRIFNHATGDTKVNSRNQVRILKSRGPIFSPAMGLEIDFGN